MSFKTKGYSYQDMKPGDTVAMAGRIGTKPPRCNPPGYDMAIIGYCRIKESYYKRRKGTIIGRICMDQCFVDVVI